MYISRSYVRTLKDARRVRRATLHRQAVGVMDKEKEVKEREIFFFAQTPVCLACCSGGLSDRANFMLRNALWGVALGMHAQVNNNFHA
jgi:hypothetical protein